MHKTRLVIIIAVLFLVAFVITFNYGGCGGGGGSSSGSSGGGGSLPAQIISPNPSSGATNIPITTPLSWGSTTDATSYDVYFGTTSTPPYQYNTSDTSYYPGTLAYSTPYYWRIDSKNSNGTTTGNVWSFQTETVPVTPPAQVTSPTPADGATNLPITQQLSWASASGANSYDVYFGTTSPGAYIGNQASTSYNSGILAYSTPYFWRIDSKNSTGTNTGNVWSFTTAVPAVDDYLWVVNWGGYVTRIKKSDLTTTTITVGTKPVGVAVDEIYCWVTNNSSGTVTRIQKSNPVISTTIAVGSTPDGVAVDGTYCWVTNYNSNTVTRIQKSNLSTTTITVGSLPQGIAVDETYCWVANLGSKNVTRIVKSTLATFNIAVGTGPYGVAVDETYCWVANNGDIIRILKSNPAITTTIAAGGGPRGVAVDETYCWVANYATSGTLTRIVKSTLATTTIAVGSDPVGVAVDDTYCWVANYGSNYVTRIVKSTLDTTNITVGGNPYSVGDMTGYAYDNYSNK